MVRIQNKIISMKRLKRFPFSIFHFPFPFYLLPFTFCLLLFSGCRPAAAPVSVSNKPATINNVPQTNLPMPPATNIENLGWNTFDQSRQTLGDLKGKVVILDFWATYCPPCLEEIPHLVELQKKYQDLQIVGLHVGGDEDKPKVPTFVEKLKINYTLAYPQNELTDALLGDDRAIPQTVIFDRDGKLVKKFVGFDEIIKLQLDQVVQDALAK